VPSVRIPHRAPLRFLAETCARVGDWLLVAAEVPADHDLAVDGAIGPAWLIEIAAQASAAWMAEGDGREAGERGGRLVGVKDWRWLGRAAAGAALAVRVRRSGALGDLAQFECEIAQAGVPVAAGVLTVARPA
jgi:predicted hotdog family 3-hydroxylacyl-ACP dehydratase